MSAWGNLKKQLTTTAATQPPKLEVVPKTETVLAPEKPKRLPMTREYVERDGVLHPVAWRPTHRQALLIATPVFEFLAWGNRGGGKSEWMLADFCSDVGKGLGADWRGLIIRREYKDLADIVERSKKGTSCSWTSALLLRSRSSFL